MDKRPKNLVPGKLNRSSEYSYIDELPDQILVEILSRLAVKEAVKTRTVSRRWRNLWIFSTTDGEKGRLTRSDEYLSRGAMVVRYKSEKKASVQVIFAFDDEKDGEILRDDLITFSEFNRAMHRPSAPVSDTSGWLKSARLTTLYLDSVSLLTNIFQYIIKKCSNLETLVVANVEIKYASVDLPRLKHLEFLYCKDLREIYIPMEGLVFLKLAKFGDRALRVGGGAIGNLTRVCLEGTFCLKMISGIHGTAPFLEKLELNMDLIREMSLIEALEIPTFKYVKDLKLIFDFSSSQLMDLALFIMACPFLQKLTLVYGSRKFRHDYVDDHKYIHCDEELMVSYMHQHLRVVEFIGWFGHENEVQFTNFVMKTATNLQNLIFFPSTPHHRDRFGDRTFDPRLREGDRVDKKAIASANLLIKEFNIRRRKASTILGKDVEGL